MIPLPGSNYDLVIPVFIVFVVLRTKSHYNVAQRLLHGVRYYVHVPSEDTNDKDTTFEGNIKRLQLAQTQFDSSSKESSRFLTMQLCYPPYETSVYLTVCTTLAYIVSTTYHLIHENEEYSCWIVLMIWAMLFYHLHSSIQILYLTGMAVLETNIAMMVGFLSFALVFGTLLLSPLAAISEIMQGLTIHTIALFMQISPAMAELSTFQSSMTTALNICISGVVGLVAMGTVIPIMRFSHTFVLMMFGRDQPHHPPATLAIKILLMADYLLSLVVALLFGAPLLYDHYPSQCRSMYGRSNTCADPTVSTLHTMQFWSLLILLFARLGAMKAHLQSLVDTPVFAVAAQVCLRCPGHGRGWGLSIFTLSSKLSSLSSLSPLICN